jgi:DNA-binding NarL/FixJ family response regulator
MIKIILADDHQIVRHGLRSLLSAEPDMEVVGEADNGRAVVRLVQEKSPQVVIMDISMPDLNGIEATRQIVNEAPGIKIIALVVKDFVIGWSPQESSAYSILTTREREVLQLMAEGKNTNQIADSLCVSVKTVEAHRKQLMNKLDIHSVAELTKYAIRQGLTSLEH